MSKEELIVDLSFDFGKRGTLILAISALATTAGITPWALLVAAVLGAIAGDGFSFWLGHRYRRQILSGRPLNRFPG